jgi:hypothetical protein
MRKLIALFLVGVMLLALVGYGAASERDVESLKIIRELGPGVYEVEPRSEPLFVHSYRIMPDEKTIFTISDFVFKGRVKSAKEVAIRWAGATEEDDVKFAHIGGPYSHVIIAEMEPLEVLYGALPEPRNTIRVMYPNSSWHRELPCFILEEGSEYYILSATMAELERIEDASQLPSYYLDESEIQRRQENDDITRRQNRDIADVSIWTGTEGIFPVLDGRAASIPRHEFVQAIKKQSDNAEISVFQAASMSTAQEFAFGVATPTTARSIRYSKADNILRLKLLTLRTLHLSESEKEQILAFNERQTDAPVQFFRDGSQISAIAEEIEEGGPIIFSEEELRENLTRLSSKYRPGAATFKLHGQS